MDNSKILKEMNALWSLEHDGNLYCIQPLMFHVALLINPQPLGGHEDRYCYHNAEIAKIAVEEFIKTGEMRYWKKHHTKNISVVGCYAYGPDSFHVPENALHKVPWDCSELEKKYKHTLF